MTRVLLIATIVLATGAGLRAQNASVNPHGDLPVQVDCSTCHRTDQWTPLLDTLAFDHNVQTRFALTGSHVSAKCHSCHEGDRFDQPKAETADCATCHVDVHQGAFPNQCVECHNTVSFDDVRAAEIHNRTRFPLDGSHEQLSCASCHETDEDGAFSPLETTCVTCHVEDYDLAHGEFEYPAECESCHNTLAWADANVFDHAFISGGFELMGAHELTTCTSCHLSGNFAAKFSTTDQNDCATCHQSEYEQQHAALGFPTACLECHQLDRWEDATFEHTANSAGFDLLDAHEVLPCSACHGPPPDLTPTFSPLDDQDCATCHQSEYDEQHGGTGYPTACLDCHSSNSWEDAIFDHLADSRGFDLLGAHEELPCSACHGPPPGLAPTWNPANDQDCATCHQTDYEAQHGEAGFPTACLDCHGTDTWEGATFDHATNSDGFDLIDAHDALPCSACHGPPPDLTPTWNPINDQDCATCHQPEYDENHVDSGYPTACLECHNTSAWEDVTFDHINNSDGFDLLGAHDALPCSACHGPPPNLTPTWNPINDQDCATCHQIDYDESHADGGFPTTCLDCHGTDTWEGATFDHATNSDGFDLLGAHDALPCAACHGPPPNLTPTWTPFNDQDCATCHQSEYEETHRESGFHTICLDCHGVNTWEDATFDHAAVAGGFDLLGTHSIVECSECHGPPPDLTPIFNTTDDRDCATCHESDFEKEHEGSGTPITCLDCHGVNTWEDANFEHATVAGGFDLLGTHDLLLCSACHGPPPIMTAIFDTSDDQDCAACHQTDYDNEHGGSGTPTACLDCHGTDTWSGATFDHASSSSGFDLLDAHESLPCSACHGPPPNLTPIWNPANDQDCATCHRSEFDAQHDGSTFPAACLECHVASTWENPTFDHVANSDGFDLLDAHESLPCSACHGPPPNLTPTWNPANDQDCATCHQSDYDTQHGGSGFPTACLECHTASTWENATFDHVVNSDGFDLLGAHDALPCSACHGPPPNLRPTWNPANDQDCATCHQSDYDTQHGGSGFPTACLECHTASTWENATFDHVVNSDGFDLLGAHDALPCSACHGPPPDLTPTFNPANDQDCATCHQSDYDAQHGGSGFPTACLECHTVDSFENATFDHVTNSGGFDLLGAHDVLPCSACHGPPPNLTPTWNPASDQDCATCHQSDYDEQHGGSGFPTACLECHTIDSFENATFDHATNSGGFDLLGAHDVLPCSACHGPPPNLTPTFNPANDQDCATCHQSDYDAQHGGSGFPTACLECHTVDSFENATFDHATNSGGFDLLGAHDALPCSACHGPPPDLTPTFNPANDQDCATCHQSDYDAQHGGSGFPTACLECHTVDSFENATFDHVTNSGGFDLLGAHDALPCSACHGPPPNLTPTWNPANDQDCATCHQSDYDEQHGGSGFPTACLDCHTIDSFENATFDHATNSGGFDLLGAHDVLPCSACHGPPPNLTPTFNPANDQDCATCHQSDYDAQHGGSGFPTACLECHTIDSFENATFDHATNSGGFDLLGAHDALPCSACHGPPPNLTPTFNPANDQDCATCHQSDYDAQHGGSGFPTACLECHTVDSFENATFDHATNSGGFDLLGAHDVLPCSACHGPPPNLTPTWNPANDQDCATCHQSDYDAQHGGSGFPTACLECHTVDSFENATFDHATNSGGFDLLGAHDVLPCSACHGPPPNLTPTWNPASDQDCATCHQSDYDAQHGGSGFPTACLECHTIDSFENATFDHVTNSGGFDLLGAHDALPCSACHGPPPNLTPTWNPANDQDCATCHQSDYDTQHGGSGFPTACLECHTVDSFENATFDHVTNSGGFDLLGAHDALPCSACHGPPPGLTPTWNPANDQDCATCHQSDYDTQHGGSGFPTACLECHTVDSFENATFDHATNSGGFDLLGAHDALPCSACHGPPPNLTPTFNPANDQDCATCHQSDYDEQHGGSGFPTACLECHTIDSFENATFDHATNSGGFDLLGAHDVLPCSACHGPPPNLTPTWNPASDQDCATCHQSDYDTQHSADGYPTTCLDCHDTNSFDFDHDADFFPIDSGTHQGAWVQCQDCHPQPQAFSIFTCITCHEHNQIDVDKDHSEVDNYVYDSITCLSCHPTGNH